MNDSSTADSERSPSRTFPILMASAAVLAGVVVVASWGSSSPTAAPVAPIAPFVIERQPDGAWPPLPGSAQGGVKLSVDVSTMHAVTNSTSNSTSQAIKGAFVSYRSVLVTTPDEDPLAQAVARRVVGRLQQDAHVQQIRYRPMTAEVPTGGQGPELVVKVELEEVSGDLTFGSGTFEAVLRVLVQDYFQDPDLVYPSVVKVPYSVTHSAEIRVETSLDRTGFATANAVFEAVANALAAPALDGLTKRLDALRADYGPPPVLSAEFAVPYRQVDEGFDVQRLVPEGCAMRLLASWSSPLVHNQTWWSGSVDAPFDEVCGQAVEAMSTAGFEVGNKNETASEFYREFRKGDVGVTVRVGAPGGRADPPRTGPGEVLVGVHYRRYASEGVVDAAVASVLDADSSPYLLVAMLDRLTGDELERGLELAVAAELHDPTLLTTRARHRHRADDVAGAADDFLRAALFADVSFDRHEQLDDVVSAAKQCEVELDLAGVAPEWLRANGFHELEKGGDDVAGVATVSRPLRGFTVVPGDDGDAVAVLFAVGPGAASDQGQRGAAVRVVDGGLRTSSSSSSTSRRSFGVGDRLTVDYEFLDPPDDGLSAVRVWVR